MDSTSEQEEDRYQRIATVSDTRKAENGSNEAMHNLTLHCGNDSSRLSTRSFASFTHIIIDTAPTALCMR